MQLGSTVTDSVSVNHAADQIDGWLPIVSHAGVYDVASMYATDIPWFSDALGRGADSSTVVPSESAAALRKFTTPVLVTTGERDYRMPFSTLQRQGVPSKLVVFPDEGHWILKSKDSQV